MATAIVMGSFLAGRLAKRFPARNLITVGILSSLLGGFLMVLLSGELSITRIVVPSMVFLLGVGFIMPAAMSMALQPFPHVAGNASAMFGFVQMGLAGLLNMTTGPLYDGTATPLGWIMLGMSGTALLVIALKRDTP